MTEERGLSEDDRSVRHIPKESERQADFETPTNARIQATLTKKDSEENPCIYCLDAYTKFKLSAYIALFGHVKTALLAAPTLFA
jgi:hypothetical protein